MRKILTLLAMIALAGCGGGGSAGTPSGPPAADVPKLAQAVLKITFPVGTSTSSTSRNPKFVSPNSNSIKITVNTVNGSAPGAYVTPNPFVAQLTTTGGSPNCVVTGGAETCTITNVTAPPGTVNYTLAVYASTDGSGTPLAEATVNETVVQGTLNTFNVTLSGVIGALVMNIPTTAFNANTPVTQTDIVKVNDPSGARIIGTAPFDAGGTVTVTDNDASPETSLVAGSGGGSATVCADSKHCTLSHGADTVNLVYTGKAASGTGGPPPVDSFTVTASTGVAGVSTQTANMSITNQLITFDVTTTDDTAHGGLPADPNYNQLTLFFTAIGVTQNFTAAELGWSNAPYSQGFTTAFDMTTCGTGASAVATIAVVGGPPNVTFAVTSKNPGTCKLTVSDSVGQSKVLWISVSTATFNVN